MKPWAPLTSQEIIAAVGCVGTIAGIVFASRPNIKDVEVGLRAKLKVRFIRWIVSFIKVYKVPIFVVLATIVTLFGVRLLEATPSSTTPSPPIETVSPPPTPPTPSDEINKVVSLDLLDPLRKFEGDFFFHNWSEDDPIVVNNKVYDRSIGVKIPKIKQENYYKNFKEQRVLHDAFIEYSLASQYQTLRFEYGIDDSSFPDDASCAPQCHFWIVVQKCSSIKDHFVEEDTLYETEVGNYYKTLQSTGDIDVSGAEAIRITFYWEFDVIQSKPLAFNLVIINPTLYLA